MKRRMIRINCYFIMDALLAKWTIIRIIGEMDGMDFTIDGRNPISKFRGMIQEAKSIVILG
ncbi:MAG: hypothetical protein ACLQGU_22705 [bacterium]